MLVIKKKYLSIFGAIILTVAVIIGSIPERYDYPPAHSIQKFPTARQPDGYTCGPTSTMLVLQYYGKDVELNEVIASTKTRWYGDTGMTSPDFIVQALKKHGIYAKIKNDNLGELKYEVSQDRPVIVLIRTGKKTWHYMVAVGYDQSQMIFSDPSDGDYYNVTNEHFALAWNFDGNSYGEDYRVDSIFGKSSDYMKVLIRATEIRTKTYIVTSAP